MLLSDIYPKVSIPLVGRELSDIPPEPTPRKERRSERCQGPRSGLRRRSQRSGDPGQKERTEVLPSSSA
jgi:hypothetical protein